MRIFVMLSSLMRTIIRDGKAFSKDYPFWVSFLGLWFASKGRLGNRSIEAAGEGPAALGTQGGNHEKM